MIKSYTDYKYYLEQDLGTFSYGALTPPIKSPIYLFIKYLRTCEYLINVKHIPFRTIRLYYNKWKYRNLSIRLGFSIPFNVFEYGLKLPHYGGIIINGNVKIGKNCSIRPFTVIGNKMDGDNQNVPIIGDNVEIGCNVSIIGKVKIGDNVSIGAGSVVVTDIPANTVCVGNPAKVIKIKKAD